MAKKQFKAESKRLLDLMIHSIYTHKEIFLRELISNASDALDKLYFSSLTDSSIGMNREDFEITLMADKEARTLTISDNGIGMTQEELQNNLGVIAKSGSFDFKQENDNAEDVDVIGQFGVGFYSAFMVSDEVTVQSRGLGQEQAYCWKSSGTDGYTTSACEKEQVGTIVTLHIKPDTDEENYSKFLDEHCLQALVKKYSDYIRYPIRMSVSKQRKKKGTEEWESYQEIETLNSMVPIWRQKKSNENQKEFNQFYQEKFMDYNDPLKVVQFETEGTATYHALLYFPAKPPFDYYTKEFEKGLQLYSSGVLIMEKCPDLLPDYFSFVKGLVDSEDLSLNISREMLQHDRQLKIIAKSLEKKIKSELSKMLQQERECYEAFFEQFGLQLKAGVYADYGMHKDELKDLLLFCSTAQDGMVTLQEYVTRMKEEQKEIYYACGSSVAQIKSLPQLEMVTDKGYEVLYLTEGVDEFVFKTLQTYQEKPFRNVAAQDLDLQSDEEKEELQKQTEKHKELFETMQSAIGSQVSGVKISNRLRKSAVCLSTDGAISLEMEKVLNQMPGEQKVKAERVLEINPKHPIFKVLCNLLESDKEKLKEYSLLLYQQAELLEGILPKDPAAYAERVCRLMSEN